MMPRVRSRGLIDMNVEPYLVASTVEGIIAQRLARRVCQACCEMYSPETHELAAFIGHNGNGTNGILPKDLKIPRGSRM